MRASTLATRSSTTCFHSSFDSQTAQKLANDYGASLSHNVRKRKMPQRNTPVSYYEGDTESEDEFEGKSPEDTIIVDGPWEKKRKMIVLDDSDDDDDDGDIPPVKLTVVKDDSLKEDGPAGKLFRGFPTEIHQQIADFLPDSDVVNFACICEVTRASITNIVWKRRFDRLFDSVPDASIGDLVAKYKSRRALAKQWTAFDLGVFGGHITPECRQVQKKNQGEVLKMLRFLILESNARKTEDDEGKQVVQGSNLQFIYDLITGENGASYVDIIDSVFNTEFDNEMHKLRDMSRVVSASVEGTLVYAVQLCLTPISLNPRFCNNRRVSHFDLSQYQAYDTPARQPMFCGKYKQDVNLRWLLHVVNFFKYHLTVNAEGLLAHHYKDLEADQFPQPWEGRIEPGTKPLKSHWKGAYTFMDPTTMASLRMGNGNGKNSSVHTDELDNGEVIQDMTFFFEEGKSNQSFPWPEQWDQIVCSDPFSQISAQKSKRASPRKAKEVKKPQIKQFWGTCRGKHGHFFGRIHAMIPQQGIHGFQRMTMMKFYTKTDENGNQTYDPDQVWAFEGCVLPGGRIIVGRWWDSCADPNAFTTQSGPFLWWNVDRSAATIPIRPEEAFEFLDSVVDPDIGLI